MKATIVVGNPKLGSRTAEVATSVAQLVLRHCVVPPDEPVIELIELASLAPALFDWGDPTVAAAKAAVLDSHLLVVASPTYKASFTGLLKAFADQFARDELAALTVIPLMLGASPIHNLAVEHALRPVLIEIGASCPSRGLFVVESELNALPALLEAWWRVWGGVVEACVKAPRSR